MYLDLKMMEMGKGTKSFLKSFKQCFSVSFQYILQSLIVHIQSRQAKDMLLFSILSGIPSCNKRIRQC
jgi:hypothetical protein